MKENPEFIGRPYNENEKKNLENLLQDWSEELSKPIEGEPEKTEEETRLIETINSIIGIELKSLGIEKYDPIKPEKVHILPGNIFMKKFPNFEGKAFFRSTSDVVYVNKDKINSKAHLLSRLLHELIHRASTTKFYADNDGGVYDARVGYRIRSPWKSTERINRLKGFSELMTDYTVYKILLKNQSMLQESFGITKEDIQGSIYNYMHYGPILESIIKKISVDKGIDPLKIFNNLEKGQFENNIFALKDIEKSFGDGALEILSLLETLKEDKNNDNLEEMIKKFFAEEHELNRQSLHSEILAFVENSEKDL